jgi:alkanesulfonate monooxygenase SsuD/methylene tetrahydromethanopterin reductase-like flavin-dependent oxidoreductase (luciferase family)
MWVSTERQWGELVERATWCEATGWCGLWVADHYMSQTPDNTPGDGRILECWTVLGALGALVPRIRLTSMVSPVTIHHPVVLAKRLATIDEITDGRAVLGLGAGWQINEHAAYGIDLPAPGPRVDRFEEAIEVIHQLFHEDRANFKGDYYTLTDAPFSPRPTNVPLLVGTASPRMLRLTAKWADEWNTWGDPGTIATVTAAFNEACAKEGRDPSTIRRSAQAMVFMSEDPERVAKLRERAPAGRSLVGGISELVDLVGQYRDLGLDELAFPDFTLGTTPEARAEAYATLHDGVLSQF